MSAATIIRQALRADDDTIDGINETVFSSRAEADLVRALRQSGDVAVELVAQSDGGAVGHILLSRLKAPQNSLALAPVSVRPEHQRTGIGSLLVRQAIAWATSEGWTAIFLLGDPAYYRRFGFSVEKADCFQTDYPKAYFMVLELQPQALSRLAGSVVYPAAFENLS